MTSTSDLLRTPGLTEFLDPPVPEGESPYVPGAGPGREIRIVESDPAWPEQAEAVIARIRAALGPVVVGVEHVGSTSVPGLPAKPILDVDLRVPDSDDEASYVPPLEAAGFALAVREPWWYGHRLLRGSAPAVNLHVYGPDSAESARQRLFRDWLRTHPEDRDRYAAAKRDAAAAARRGRARAAVQRAQAGGAPRRLRPPLRRRRARLIRARASSCRRPGRSASRISYRTEPVIRRQRR